MVFDKTNPYDISLCLFLNRFQELNVSLIQYKVITRFTDDMPSIQYSGPDFLEIGQIVPPQSSNFVMNHVRDS